MTKTAYPFANDTLLSDQIDHRELAVLVRELQRTIDAGTDGDVVEFGCYVGTASIYLAKLLMNTDKRLWLYDSFQGLPDKTKQDDSPAGLQFVTGELNASRKQLQANLKRANVPMPKITKGWFSDLNDNDVPTRVAFAFLDGDYYHSVLDPLKLLWPHLCPGATIVVDDYANEALPGAAKAVDEWLLTHDGTLSVEASLAIIHT